MHTRDRLMIILCALGLAAGTGIPLPQSETAPPPTPDMAPASPGDPGASTRRPTPVRHLAPRKHPVSEDWVFDGHIERYETKPDSCLACHGADLQGTIRSRAAGPRQFDLSSTRTVTLTKGAPVGCAHCHEMPAHTRAD